MQRYAPWITWTAALAVTVWLGRDIVQANVAPGMARLHVVTLASPQMARVLAIEVAPGDRVTVGQVLARLETSSIEADLAVARADLERLRLDVVAERTSLQTEAAKTAAQLSDDAERAALTLAQIQLEVVRDQAELEQLDEQITQQTRIVEQRLASASTLNTLKLRRASLARKVKGYRRTLREARRHAQAGVERKGRHAETTGGGTDTTGVDLTARVAPHQAAVIAQAARIEQLEALRRGLTLTAPLAGRVGQVLLHEGDTAGAGAGVITIVDDRPTQAVAFVDQVWAHKIRPGQRARLRPSDGSKPRRLGRVIGFGPAISEIPIRFRPIPNQPAFGREIYIQLHKVADAPPLPGQAFDIVFEAPTRDPPDLPNEPIEPTVDAGTDDPLNGGTHSGDNADGTRHADNDGTDNTHGTGPDGPDSTHGTADTRNTQGTAATNGTDPAAGTRGAHPTHGTPGSPNPDGATKGP